MNTKAVAKGGLLMLAAILFAAAEAGAQSKEQNVTVTVRPAQTVEQRVSDDIKEKGLREAAEDRVAAEKSARIAARDPKAMLSRARTFYISSDTEFFESVQLQNALRERREFGSWEMVVVDGWKGREVADVFVEVDRPLFTYTFTYQITDRGTGVILATGKVTAFDGNAAAPKLAGRIIEDIKKARGELKDKR